MDSRIERNEWILECERVSSKLRFVVKNDAKEWRSHIESSKTYNENIKKLLPESRATLEKISDELGKLLEKIGKREKNINHKLFIVLCFSFFGSTWRFLLF